MEFKFQIFISKIIYFLVLLVFILINNFLIYLFRCRFLLNWNYSICLFINKLKNFFFLFSGLLKEVFCIYIVKFFFFIHPKNFFIPSFFFLKTPFFFDDDFLTLPIISFWNFKIKYWKKKKKDNFFVENYGNVSSIKFDLTYFFLKYLNFLKLDFEKIQKSIPKFDLIPFFRKIELFVRSLTFNPNIFVENIRIKIPSFDLNFINFINFFYIFFVNTFFSYFFVKSFLLIFSFNNYFYNFYFYNKNDKILFKKQTIKRFLKNNLTRLNRFTIQIYLYIYKFNILLHYFTKIFLITQFFFFINIIINLLIIFFYQIIKLCCFIFNFFWFFIISYLEKFLTFSKLWFYFFDLLFKIKLFFFNLYFQFEKNYNTTKFFKGFNIKWFLK